MGNASQFSLIGYGLATTLALSAAVWIISIFLGALFAIIRFCRIPLLQHAVAAWIYLFRSVPIVLLIAGVHFGLLPLLGIESHLFLSAFLGLALSASAYFAEVFRGGLATLTAGELESAAALGLSVKDQWREIILPLLILRSAPALINQTVSLIKDTALASLIGLIELSRSAEIIYQVTLHPLPWLALIGVIYFLVCFSLSSLAKHLSHQPVAAI